MELFLVRHGETDANAKHIIQGWLDMDLNVNGINQAQKTADSFTENVDVIYSSDLKRAAQTASAFRHKFPDIPYFEDKRLRERNFGDAVGYPRDKYDWDEFWSSPDNQVTIPNAETLNSFNERVKEFINDLKSSNYRRVLIVAHGGTINRLRHLVAGEDYVQHDNASVTYLTLS